VPILKALMTGTFSYTDRMSSYNTYVGKVGDFVGGATPILEEMLRMFPDGLVFMTGLYALLTLSYPFAILFGTLIESTLFFHILRSIATYFRIGGTDRESGSEQCRSGFTLLGTETFSMFTSRHDVSFPSSPIYMTAVASSYFLGSLLTLSSELEALGSGFSSRFYISAVFLSLFILLVVSTRLVRGCDGYFTALASMFVGLLIGLVLVYQNYSIFGNNGKQAINLIGIPILRGRTVDGQPIYICPKK